jgi:tRNA threonylcarbamoyladenosine biosynthesis protein TsaB
MSRALLIETSGKAGHVAIAADGRIVARRLLSEARRHARDLAPAVAEMLREAGWSPGLISHVIVGLGPGSYTGLRVGIVSAKIFSYATRALLIGIPTFETLAAAALAEAGSVIVIADAQQNRVYHQCFGKSLDGEHPVELSPLRVLTAEELFTGSWPASAITGPGLHKLASRLPPSFRPMPAPFWETRLDILFRLGLARIAGGRIDEPYRLAPIYLRPSAAEEQWKVPDIQAPVDGARAGQ